MYNVSVEEAEERLRNALLLLFRRDEIEIEHQDTERIISTWHNFEIIITTDFYTAIKRIGINVETGQQDIPPLMRRLRLDLYRLKGLTDEANPVP